MIKLGNLFLLAEKELQKEKRLYTLSDVIDYAILIRKWLDRNPRKIKKFMNLTREELTRNNKESRKRFYLKTGR